MEVLDEVDEMLEFEKDSENNFRNTIEMRGSQKKQVMSSFITDEDDNEDDENIGTLVHEVLGEGAQQKQQIPSSSSLTQRGLTIS